ncbi:MAG: hypothetical protein ACI4QZ_01620 [Eubacteriales bacterium]
MTKKKKIIIISFLALCVFALISLLFPLIKVGHKADSKETQPAYTFYEADYDADIFENEEYLGLARELSYTDGALTVTYKLTDDLSNVDDALEFFASYFQTIINGDYEHYPSFFSNKYTGDIPEKFTMQMVYNISLEKLPYLTEDGSTVYRVDYMIYRNNGTFRPEIGSDGCIPQYVVLEKSENSYLITQIYTLKQDTEVVS